MARPNWEYIRVDVLLPRHPKLAGLPRSARWTLVELWCFAGSYHTDGFISDDVWGETGPPADRRKLVERGLAEKVTGGYQMHDFTGPNGHQRSKAEIEELSQRRADAGRKGGSARGKSEASASANDQASAPDLVAGCSDTAEAEAVAVAEAKKDPPPAPSSRVPPRGRATATRLPAGFTVTPQLAAWAAEHVPSVDTYRETERFRDHWNSASGANARKLDWPAAWRNWMRRADDDKARQPQQRKSRTDEITEIFAENYQMAAQIEQWEAASDANGNREIGRVRPRALPAAGD